MSPLRMERLGCNEKLPSRSEIGPRRRRSRRAAASLFVVALLSASLSLPVAAWGGEVELPRVVTAPYRIQVGDVLEIDFFKSTRLRRTATVGPDGSIFLPLVGAVNALERTVADLTAELEHRYSREMVDPQITVSVSTYSGMLVYVGGEVEDPGMQSYRGGLTLLQAVIDAGGFAKTAKLRQVLLIRKAADNSPVSVVVDVKQMLRDARFEGDVALAPADVIYVPRRRIANVNIFIQQFFTENLPFSLFLGYSF